MKTIKIIRNTHNKSQFLKWNLLTKLVGQIKWESFPQNCGYCESEVRRLFGGHSYYPNAAFENCVVQNKAGDVYSPGVYILDPARLTNEQCKHIARLLAPDALRPDVSVIKKWLWDTTRVVTTAIPA